MSVSSLWNSFTHQKQKDTFHNFATRSSLDYAIVPVLWNLPPKYLTFSPMNAAELVQCMFYGYRNECPKGIKLSPEASISSAVPHFQMTHLNQRGVVMDPAVIT